VKLLKPLTEGGPETSGLDGDKRNQLRLLLAEVYLGLGPQYYDEAPPLLDALDPRSAEAERAEILRQVIDFYKIAATASGDESERIEKNPSDAEARFVLAAVKAQRGDFAGAFEELLWIVGHNRRFRDDAARKVMLALFQYLGDQQDVYEYRRRLQVVL
jgi:putative thioredoxin